MFPGSQLVYQQALQSFVMSFRMRLGYFHAQSNYIAALQPPPSIPKMRFSNIGGHIFSTFVFL